MHLLTFFAMFAECRLFPGDGRVVEGPPAENGFFAAKGIDYGLLIGLGASVCFVWIEDFSKLRFQVLKDRLVIWGGGQVVALFRVCVEIEELWRIVYITGVFVLLVSEHIESILRAHCMIFAEDGAVSVCILGNG